MMLTTTCKTNLRKLRSNLQKICLTTYLQDMLVNITREKNIKQNFFYLYE